MARRITVPRALIDYLRRPGNVADSESRDPAVQRSLKRRAQAASHVVGLTSHRGILNIDESSAAMVCSIGDEAASDPNLSEAGQSAIAHAVRDIRREFALN